MSVFLRRFITDETGASTIEYGLIFALIATAVGAAVLLLGAKLETGFSSPNIELH